MYATLQSECMPDSYRRISTEGAPFDAAEMAECLTHATSTEDPLSTPPPSRTVFTVPFPRRSHMAHVHLVDHTKAPHVMTIRSKAVPVLMERYHEYMTAIDALSPKERDFDGYASQHPNLEQLKVATSAALAFYSTYAYVLGFPCEPKPFEDIAHAAWRQGMIGSDTLFGMVGRMFDACPSIQDPETFWPCPAVWRETAHSRFMVTRAYFDACSILNDEDFYYRSSSSPIYRRATACLMWVQKCLNAIEAETTSKAS